MVEPISEIATIVVEEAAKEAIRETAKETAKEAIREAARERIRETLKIRETKKEELLTNVERNTLEKVYQKNSLIQERIKNLSLDIKDGGIADKERAIKRFRGDLPNLWGQLGEGYSKNRLSSASEVLKTQVKYEGTRGDIQMILKKNIKLPVIDIKNGCSPSKKIFHAREQIGVEVKYDTLSSLKTELQSGHLIHQIRESVAVNDKTLVAVPKDLLNHSLKDLPNHSLKEILHIVEQVENEGAKVIPILPAKDAAIKWFINKIIQRKGSHGF